MDVAEPAYFEATKCFFFCPAQAHFLRAWPDTACVKINSRADATGLVGGGLH
jgi:hypothetical protein